MSWERIHLPKKDERRKASSSSVQVRVTCAGARATGVGNVRGDGDSRFKATPSYTTILEQRLDCGSCEGKGQG